MFFLTQPSDQKVREFIESQRSLPFSYRAVGATATTAPADFDLDHNRIQLGHGQTAFDRAVANLRAWRQFDLGWVRIVPDDVPIEVGSVVAVQARAYGSWSLNACRIVYVINEARRFGFAYGTLPHHVECGEERFVIEWSKEDDSVWYDILAFSRPHHPMVRVAFPLARLLQRRFARESLAALLKLELIENPN